MCKERGLEISTFSVNNQFFVLEILRKKWLNEFPKLELVLDRLEKRDPTSFPPENIHFNFLYYYLSCSQKDTLQEINKIGSDIDYDIVEAILKIYSTKKNKCFTCSTQEIKLNNLYANTELAYYYFGSFNHPYFDFSKLITEFDRVCFWTASIDTIWNIKQIYPCLRIEKYY